MSIKPWCYWSIGVKGDGSNDSVVLNLLTDPFVLGAANAVGGGAELGFTFSLGLSNLPSGISVISCSDGQTVTATLGVLGAITFSWPNAIPNGDEITMYGVLTF